MAKRHLTDLLIGDQTLPGRANLLNQVVRANRLISATPAASEILPAIFAQTYARYGTQITSPVAVGMWARGVIDDANTRIGGMYGLDAEAEIHAGQATLVQGLVAISQALGASTVSSRLTGVSAAVLANHASAVITNMMGLRANPILLAGAVSGRVSAVEAINSISGGTVADTYVLHLTTESGGTVTGRRHGIFLLLSHADAVGQVIRAHASQAANLQEWQNSAGAVIASMGPDGRFRLRTGFWHGSTEGGNRFFFAEAGTSYIAGAGETPIVFRNGADVDIASMDSVGRLDLRERIRVRGGSPAEGKVLTSDADGLGRWEYAVPQYAALAKMGL